ncbi:hypothetical protein BDV95DRAFT_575247 [Massariosphaeria phaeospora]|uniref:Uncharacterized protein n=1 Tax=Massariosphaeria phaeospora TaxID=100035 RepID=A0A7C8MA45_9PLEO|nr:hypothetical protein BDV95DRAFT_575247 [Massariosphaeria phaeospora]
MCTEDPLFLDFGSAYGKDLPKTSRQSSRREDFHRSTHSSRRVDHGHSSHQGSYDFPSRSSRRDEPSARQSTYKPSGSKYREVSPPSSPIGSRQHGSGTPHRNVSPLGSSKFEYPRAEMSRATPKRPEAPHRHATTYMPQPEIRSEDDAQMSHSLAGGESCSLMRRMAVRKRREYRPKLPRTESNFSQGNFSTWERW